MIQVCDKCGHWLRTSTGHVCPWQYAFAEFLRVCSLYSQHWEVGPGRRMGLVYVDIDNANGDCWLEPHDARALATVLLAAADEAERR